MSKSPKVRDVLEVFFEKFEAMETQFQKASEQLPLIENRLFELKKLKIPIDISLLEQKQKDINMLQERNIGKLEETMNLYLEKIKKHTKFQSYYILGTIILLFFCIGLFSLLMSESVAKKDAEEKIRFYKNEAVSRNNYLKDNGLIDKYKEWRQQ